MKLPVPGELAAYASKFSDERIDLSFLLNVEACKVKNTVEAKSSLLNTLFFSPRLDTILYGHSTDIISTAFSPDGKILAAGCFDNSIVLWDIETRKKVGIFEGVKNHCLVIDSDKTILAHIGPVECLAFSPDGKMLASGSFDKSVILWNLKTQKLEKKLEKHESYVSSIAFSPDGRLLATGSFDNTINLWNISGENVTFFSKS